MSATMHADPVVSGIDPFSAGFFADLYAFHGQLTVCPKTSFIDARTFSAHQGLGQDVSGADEIGIALVIAGDT